MSKILAVFLFEFRSTLRRRSFQISTAAFPLVIITVILVVTILSTINAGADEESTLLGYVDRWGKLPTQSPAGSRMVPYSSEEAARSALLDEDIEAYFVIPADYVETGLVQEYSTSESSIFNANAESAVLKILLVQALVEGHVPESVADRLQSPLRIERARLTAEGDAALKERDTFSRFLVPYIFGLMLLMSIFMTSGLLVQAIAEEKQSRTVEILLSSVSAFTLITGKVLGLGAAGLLQIIIWLLTARVLIFAGESLVPLPLENAIVIEPAVMVLIILFFILGYLFFATLLAAIGAMATTPHEGGQMSAIVIVPGVVPYMLLAVIINEPDGHIARILTFIPITAPITAMLRLSSSTIPWADFGVSLLILVFSIGGGLYLSARVFRAFLLLYGRRPGLREIWRALRTAS
jgi:ABC-2 type transport system permease protein